MTQPSILSAMRHLIDEMAGPLASRLPIEIAPNRDGPIDRLRPRIAIEPTNMLTTVRLVRTPHASEGDQMVTEDIDLYLLDRSGAAARIAAMLATLEELLEQDRAIMLGGGDPERPAHRWFTCHPVMLEAARHWGWNLDDMVAPSEITQRDDAAVIVRNDTNILTPLLTAERDGATIHCGRYQRRRRLLCAHLSVMNGDAILAQYSDEDRPAVRIPGRWLPETLLDALPGRRMREVVDDTRLGPLLDLTIASAHRSGAGTTFEIESEAEPMERIVER